MRQTSFQLILLLCLLGTVGCAAPRAEVAGSAISQNNTIFNSRFTRLYYPEPSRPDWPATSRTGDSGEGVDYSITIRDRQGNYGSDRDHLTRQFHSVRSGRTWR